VSTIYAANGAETTILDQGDLTVAEYEALRKARQSLYPPSSGNPFTTKDELLAGDASLAAEVALEAAARLAADNDLAGRASALETTVDAARTPPVAEPADLSLANYLRLINQQHIHYDWFTGATHHDKMDKAVSASKGDKGKPLVYPAREDIHLDDTVWLGRPNHTDQYVRGIHGNFARVLPAISNKPVFDWTGGHGPLRFADRLYIDANNPQTMPSTAILFARTNQTPDLGPTEPGYNARSSGLAGLYDLVIDGYFTKAALTLIASETLKIFGGWIQAKSGKAAVFLTRNNQPPYDVYSPNVAIGVNTFTNVFLFGPTLTLKKFAWFNPVSGKHEVRTGVVDESDPVYGGVGSQFIGVPYSLLDLDPEVDATVVMANVQNAIFNSVYLDMHQVNPAIPRFPHVRGLYHDDAALGYPVYTNNNWRFVNGTQFHARHSIGLFFQQNPQGTASFRNVVTTGAQWGVAELAHIAAEGGPTFTSPVWDAPKIDMLVGGTPAIIRAGAQVHAPLSGADSKVRIGPFEGELKMRLSGAGAVTLETATGDRSQFKGTLIDTGGNSRTEYQTLETRGALDVRGTMSFDAAGTTVAGAPTFTGKVGINGHLDGGGGVPAIAKGNAMGSDAGNPTISGSDVAGRITVTTGTLSLTGNTTIAAVTFVTPYTAAPFVVISPGNRAAAELSGTTQVYVPTPTATGFELRVASGSLAASTSYIWNYMVIE
jgi:hypothetical protein